MRIRTIVLYCLTLNITVIKLGCCDGNTRNQNNIATNQNYNTVGCINHILTQYFPCGTLTTFVNPSGNVDQLIKIANGDNICHSIIVRSFDDRNWFIWTNVYVIAAENVLELRSGMIKLTRDVFWNPRAKFIVQVNSFNDADVEIQEVFKILLKYRIFNVVLLKSGKDDAVIFTYHPFDNHNCGKHFDKVITLGTCENSENIIDYFPNKIPGIMKNCRVKVVASDDIPNFISKSSNYTVYGKFVSGLEQYVLDTVAAREGLFIDYDVFNVYETFGIVLPNRTATGLLNFIDKDKADIAAGGYVLMKNRVELFDYLWGFNYAAFYLYTPAAGNRRWQRVYKEFGLSTWLLIFATTFYVILVCVLLKKIIIDDTYSILNLWGYFFGNAGTGLSRNKKFRFIIFWWAWFTFFISSFYNTALYSLISVHIHEKPHSTSMDILENLPYKPCISDNSRLFFEFAYNQSLPVGKAIRNCTYTDGSLEYASSTGKYYSIEMDYSYKLKEYQYVDEVCNPKLESWIFSSTNIIVMYLARGFPFIEKFQDYAHRMYEAGLIKNHLKTINLRSHNVLQRHPKPFRQTSMIDLRMHFYILLIGYVLSFLCFLLEIWYKYLKPETRKFKRTVKTK